eukprot:751225-Hanusia_phi.AAC.1
MVGPVDPLVARSRRSRRTVNESSSASEPRWEVEEGLLSSEARIQVTVLYDDGQWYPGEICSYTETTGKFRFKLTE